MNQLIAALQSNSLPTAYWVTVVAWGIALAVQLALLRYERTGVTLTARQIAGPVVMGALIFSWSHVSSQQVQAFFAGGWSVTALVSLACAGYWHLLAVKGSPAMPRQRLRILIIAACALAILGIAFAQLALLGSSLFITATSIGYFRKQAMAPQHA